MGVNGGAQPSEGNPKLALLLAMAMFVLVVDPSQPSAAAEQLAMG